MKVKRISNRTRPHTRQHQSRAGGQGQQLKSALLLGLNAQKWEVITDGQTERVTYRVACTQLINRKYGGNGAWHICLYYVITISSNLQLHICLYYVIIIFNCRMTPLNWAFTLLCSLFFISRKKNICWANKAVYTTASVPYVGQGE